MPPDRAVLHRVIVPLVDHRVGHAAGALLLVLPVLVHQRAELDQAAAFQRLEAAQPEILHVVQVLDHVVVLLLGLVVLLLEDRGGAARIAGEEQQQIVFEIVERLGVDLERPALRRCRPC